MHSHPPHPSISIAGSAAWAIGACAALATLAVLAWLDAQRLIAPPRIVGALLAASAAVSGCGAVVQLSAVRVMRRIDQIGQRGHEPAPWVPTPSPWSLRHIRGRDGQMALADPAIVEATERRRLLAAHLREQLEAEIESRVEDALVEGFEIGYKARAAEEGGSRS